MQNNIDMILDEQITKLVNYARYKKISPLKIMQLIYDKVDYYYFEHKAYRSEFDIKVGDALKFDRVNLKLVDGAIYYFSFQFISEDRSYYLEDWGRYNKANGTIEADLREFELDEIKIQGQLIEITRELEK